MISKTESGRVAKEIPGSGSGSGTRWALLASSFQHKVSKVTVLRCPNGRQNQLLLKLPVVTSSGSSCFRHINIKEAMIRSNEMFEGLKLIPGNGND